MVHIGVYIQNVKNTYNMDFIEKMIDSNVIIAIYITTSLMKQFGQNGDFLYWRFKN